MKLSYRGTTYEYNQPTLEITQGEIIGLYRGAHWRCSTVAELPFAQVSHDLKYRGVAYTSNPTSDVCPANVVKGWQQKAAISQAAKVTLKVAGNELAKTHLNNLQHRLERRLAAARDRGDSNLLSILEAERKELSL